MIDPGVEKVNDINALPGPPLGVGAEFFCPLKFGENVMDMIKPTFGKKEKGQVKVLSKTKPIMGGQTDAVLAEKARSHTDAMLGALVEIALERQGNAAARVAAAKTVLEMGHGKAIPSAVAPGKKEQKKIDAQSNEVGSPWEDLLN